MTRYAITDLAVPEEEILRRAKGDHIAALQIAASYGYELACRDLDKHTTVKLPSPSLEAIQ
jgi:hypothetical protein